MIPLFLLVFCEVRPLLAPPVNQEVGGSNPPAPVEEKVGSKRLSGPWAREAVLVQRMSACEPAPRVSPSVLPNRPNLEGLKRLGDPLKLLHSLYKPAGTPLTDDDPVERSGGALRPGYLTFPRRTW